MRKAPKLMRGQQCGLTGLSGLPLWQERCLKFGGCLCRAEIRAHTVAGWGGHSGRNLPPQAEASLCPLKATLPSSASPALSHRFLCHHILAPPGPCPQLPNSQDMAFQSFPAQLDPFKTDLTSAFSSSALLEAEVGMPRHLHKGPWHPDLLSSFC